MAKLLSIALLLAALPAAAAPPTNCVCGEILQALTAPSKVLLTVNETRCAVNCVLSGGAGSGKVLEVVCDDVTIAANVRQSVVLATVTATAAGDVAFPTVIDPTAPSRVEPDGVQSVAGNSITVWAFNRDAASQRSVTVCASLVRP